MLVVDDSVFVDGNPTRVHEYNLRYREVMATLNLDVKDHDEELRKTFHPSEQGEVLGYWLNGTEKTWTISSNKINDVLRQIDMLIDPSEPLTDKPNTMKALQRVEGKFADFGKLSSFIKVKLMMVSFAKNRATSLYESENELPESKQSKQVWLSPQAKKDLRYLRAIAARLETHRLPLEDPRPDNSISAEVVVFCDASGDINNPAYCGVLITRGSLCSHDIALSYLLPLVFLTTKDETNFNYHNSILLELLSILATVIELGPVLTGRTILFVTDSLSLVRVMQKRRVPKGRNAAHALQTLWETALEAQITVRVKWKRRNSCSWTTAADALSHANFEALPKRKMPGLTCHKLQFPRPVFETLRQAAENPPFGFPCLKDRTQEHWKSHGWALRHWKYE